ncbi:cytochrome C biogenesis protein [Stenotrophomonas pictorum JCM 9942]|uniref:Cytochrome c-type biogenesis protein n=1 Tax=Stenotrophomonas pictorum JCM 9942 TaxID=1236960 RepID=A0A0R0AKR0_9GAMM|nr:cytochrome c-type biogenesis protein [Stenotrophomonas pictorum]KRG42722.1 cytochrome C biogenesis protein [Stenotrophomonas pictorum JCM 9942]
MRRWALRLVLLLGTAGAVQAQPMGDPTPLQFRNPAEEVRFHALTAELRCVQCQNQSLADSNAQIAHDLRREVLTLMHEGRSDAQIKQFLVERYGQFVLYRPQMDTGTAVLWFGPGLLLLTGAGMLVIHVRRRARALPPRALDESSQEEREW